MADNDHVSIQQAAAHALALYLDAKLPDDVVVSERWPEPTVPLSDRTVTVLLAGPAEDELFDPVVVAREDDPVLPQAFYTYRFRCRRQALQLDVFTQYDVGRDDIVARLDNLLNASEADTIGALNAEPCRNGLLLALGVGWSGLADFFFEAPEVAIDPDAEQQTDYRATYRGHVDMMLTYRTTQPVARLAAIELRQKAHTGPVAPANQSTDVATITADGGTFTVEV